ncbi:MAG: FHA domain-containing protein, partial [Kiritimatiellales bacterium]|nr:FHA domain-containing protein [Kiritimatiellales bacterium]
MSHLIIEQGIDVGKEVAVPPAGMKFGRSPANDLVLDDDAVMLFHGRFFFKSDGSLWVTDFGAANKTTVDGEPVDEFQLSVGNLIEVGHTGFRVIKASQEEESASVANDAAGHGHIDLGFKREKKQLPRHHKKEKRSTFSSRLLQVLVVLMVLVVLLIVGPSLLELSKKEIAVAPQEETLLMAYERVQADTRNIFRYYLELTANGEFSIQIDDLKNDRHVSKKKQISETIRLQLSNSIEEAGFFDVDSDYAG